jgi:hypothetical protein
VPKPKRHAPPAGPSTSGARTPRTVAVRPAGEHTVATVWRSWLPDPDGPTIEALRRVCEVMDETVAGASELAVMGDADAARLAAAMFDVYRKAVDERTNLAAS